GLLPHPAAAQPLVDHRAQGRRELGADPETIFATFEREPIASASLAQVHRATTKDGRDVAVKIQYPGIERVVETDLRNFAILVRLLARMESHFDFSVLIREAERNAPKELDFINEGHNGERVAADLAHRADVRVPKIVWEHTSKRV
ncbi:MAG: AarF/UbiB family protein, partial [Dehalococcoidia bacterium]